MVPLGKSFAFELQVLQVGQMFSILNNFWCIQQHSLCAVKVEKYHAMLFLRADILRNHHNASDGLGSCGMWDVALCKGHSLL